jgi:hypothetical protein
VVTLSMIIGRLVVSTVGSLLVCRGLAKTRLWLPGTPFLVNFLVADDSTTMFFSERLSLGKFKKHLEMSREQKGRAIQAA